MKDDEDRVRLDKWLWVARFYKTRGLAAEDIARGRIQVNGQVAKASRELKPGDVVEQRQTGDHRRQFTVLGLSLQRGSATIAQGLYEESADSVAARQKAAERRRVAAEPALAIEHGRPTKRDRRDLADWNRWSASADDLQEPEK